MRFYLIRNNERIEYDIMISIQRERMFAKTEKKRTKGADRQAAEMACWVVRFQRVCDDYLMWGVAG